jgi:hypothetical protein
MLAAIGVEVEPVLSSWRNKMVLALAQQCGAGPGVIIAMMSAADGDPGR